MLRLCRRPQDGNWILAVLDEQVGWTWIRLRFRLFSVSFFESEVPWSSLLEYLGSFWKTLDWLWTTPCSLWGSFAPFDSYLTILKAPWMSQGVLLEPIGFILTCFEHQKFIQSGQGWHYGDMLKSKENRCVFIGLREWQVPFKYQNYILDALAAQLRCLDGC